MFTNGDAYAGFCERFCRNCTRKDYDCPIWEGVTFASTYPDRWPKEGLEPIPVGDREAWIQYRCLEFQPKA